MALSNAIVRALSPTCVRRASNADRVHYPLALACLLLPLIGGYMLRRKDVSEIGELAAACLLALLANAFVCGTLCEPA